MKKLRNFLFIITMVANLSGFSSCSGSDNNPVASKDIIPSNLVVSIQVLGANNSFPNGDGSGIVKCTAMATNAVKYGFKFGSDSEQESNSGVIEHTYSTVGTNEYVITVFAYSSTGNQISTFKKVTVLVSNASNAIWSDEFNVDGAIDSNKWLFETIPPNNGSWWNDEEQHYTNRLDNAYVSDGTLKIVAKKDSFTIGGSTKAYTSARLNSKFNFTYGRIDVRAKLPASAGTWPAIWMLGSNYGSVGWPKSGEIDIMEQTGWDKKKVLGTCHWFNTAGSNNASYGLDTTVSNSTTAFHVYSMEWNPSKITILVDNTPYYAIDISNTAIPNSPFHNNFFIILNVAMGGNLGGTIPDNFTQSTMEIDYVRVYK